MFLALWPIHRRQGKRPDPPTPREGKRGFERTIGHTGSDRGAIGLVQSGLTQRTADSPLAQTPPTHRRGTRLAERTVVDIAELCEFFGDLGRVTRRSFPAAFADLANQIGHEACAGR